MIDTKPNRPKGLYYAILIIAIVASVITYVVFQYQPKMYRAVGRFTYYYPTETEPSTSSVPFTSELLTKSLAESVKTRGFLEKLFNSTNNVGYDPKLLEAPDQVIQAKAVASSNVIDVSLVLSDLQALKTVSDNYFNVLQTTPLVESSGPHPVIQVLDPMFIESAPYYPKPLRYAALAFAGVILVGTMIVYAFAPTEN